MVCFWWKYWALEELNSWDIPLLFFHFSHGILLSAALVLLLPHLLPSILGSRWRFMHFPSSDPFLLHQQRFQLHPRPRRCKFLQNELTLDFKGKALPGCQELLSHWFHSSHTQTGHSTNPHPADIIVEKLNLRYLLSQIRFTAPISAELLLIPKEKIPFLPGKCFLWAGEESCALGLEPGFRTITCMILLILTPASSLLMEPISWVHVRACGCSLEQSYLSASLLLLIL